MGGGGWEGVVIVVKPADFSYDADKVRDQSCLSSWGRTPNSRRMKSDQGDTSDTSLLGWNPVESHRIPPITTKISGVKNGFGIRFFELMIHLLYLHIRIYFYNIIYSVFVWNIFGSQRPCWMLYLTAELMFLDLYPMLNLLRINLLVRTQKQKEEFFTITPKIKIYVIWFAESLKGHANNCCNKCSCFPILIILYKRLQPLEVILKYIHFFSIDEGLIKYQLECLGTRLL